MVRNAVLSHYGKWVKEENNTTAAEAATNTIRGNEILIFIVTDMQF
jgi:hypothetical protein